MTDLNSSSQAILYFIGVLDSFGAEAWNLRTVTATVSGTNNISRLILWPQLSLENHS
jgi:hypothetical protein